MLDIYGLARQKAEWVKYLACWPWEVHITGEPQPEKTLTDQIAEMKRYLNGLSKKWPRVKFAAFILATKNPDRGIAAHTHTLLVSDPRYPQRIGSLLPIVFQEAHPCPSTINITYAEGTQAAQVFGNDWTPYAISGYLTRRDNMDFNHPDLYLIDSFRPGLLKKLKGDTPATQTAALAVGLQPYSIAKEMYQYGV